MMQFNWFLEGGQFCPQPAFSRLWLPSKTKRAHYRKCLGGKIEAMMTLRPASMSCPKASPCNSG